jgi:glycosyltransferase involved in cell wall biosynthesis
MLAYWCRAFRRAGLIRTREILGHGTEEPLWFLARFPFVQQLAPWHLQQALAELRAQGRQALALHWTAIPNFVDTERFHPKSSGPNRIRKQLSIPENALVLGSVAALKKTHKRIDYLIKETAAWIQTREEAGLRPAHLIVAGARHQQSDELIRAAKALMPGRIHILSDLAHEQMPELYRALDVFVLCSLFEMMPIAVLEALASGLPVIAHQHPVLAWMNNAPQGGACLDMSRPGALAEFLWRLDSQWIKHTGANARAHAEANFAKAPVLEQYMAYYRRVLAAA